jgi:GDP-L-fucose synthase
MNKDSRIYVAGHRGLVGSAVVRQLRAQGYNNILTRTREELNLLSAWKTMQFFQSERPEYVFDCAAKVGGIMAHIKAPSEFMWENLSIQNNLIMAAKVSRVQKFLFLGSACAYPKLEGSDGEAIKESSLLTGPLEPSNQNYAIAKIAGIKLCESLHAEGHDFISVMPTNLYGSGDNYNLETSHVLPGMIHRIHLAMIHGEADVMLWGTGNPVREFLYSDDLARACIRLMERPRNDDGLINITSGCPVRLTVLADLVATAVGYTGEIQWDPSKPDGTPCRILDGLKMRKLGWQPTVHLVDGIAAVYRDFLGKQL